MFYTPNLWIHVQRVALISSYICKQLSLDTEITARIARMALFHDDTEIIAWDIISAEKQNWSEIEKAEYKAKCENAIPILVDAYSPNLWTDYEEILIEMERYQWKWTDEFRLSHAIIEYSDKLDALMEISHELYSWSPSFLNNLKEAYGFDITNSLYALHKVVKRKWDLEKVLWHNLAQEWLFALEQQLHLNHEDIVIHGHKHNRDSIQKSTTNIIYDIWRQLHFDTKNEQIISQLYTRNITE
jgi:5'-deoxynucleotidase YfbR-like HD superfamily hydrolase